MSPKFQKHGELKFDGRIIPPKAEDIEDIRGIPGAKRLRLSLRANEMELEAQEEQFHQRSWLGTWE